MKDDCRVSYRFKSAFESHARRPRRGPAGDLVTHKPACKPLVRCGETRGQFQTPRAPRHRRAGTGRRTRIGSRVRSRMEATDWIFIIGLPILVLLLMGP